MSLSVNSQSDYWLYRLSQTDSTSTAAQSESKSSSKSRTDSLDFSAQLMQMLAAAEQSNAISANSTAAESGQDSGSNEMTPDQKRAFLAQIQGAASQLAAAQDNASGTVSDMFAAINQQLNGFDASSATDDQVADLFNQVTQTMDASQASNPYQAGAMFRHKHHISGQQAEAVVDSAADSLTTDQKRSILSNLAGLLNSAGSDSSADDGLNGSSNDDSLLNAISGDLSGVDIGSATDDQVSSLFSQVLQELKDSIPSAPNDREASSSGNSEGVDLSSLPAMLRGMGSVPPPFAWNLTNTGGSDGSGSDDSGSGADATAASLTADQKRSLLADLQDKLAAFSMSLSGINEDDSTTSVDSTNNGDSLIQTLNEDLSRVSAGTLDDDQISDLYSQVMNAFRQYVPGSGN